MNIQGKKEKIIKFLEKADITVIEKIEQLIDLTRTTVSSKDVYKRITLDIMGDPMSLEEYNRDVERAIGEIEKGKSIAHDEVLRRIKKW